MVYCAAAVMAGVSWAFQTLQAAFHPALRRRAVPVVVTPFAIPVAGLDLASRSLFDLPPAGSDSNPGDSDAVIQLILSFSAGREDCRTPLR